MNLQTFNWSLPFHACKSYLPIFHACKSATKKLCPFHSTPVISIIHESPCEATGLHGRQLSRAKIPQGVWPKKIGWIYRPKWKWLAETLKWSGRFRIPDGQKFKLEDLGKHVGAWWWFGAPWFGILGVPISNNPFQANTSRIPLCHPWLSPRYYRHMWHLALRRRCVSTWISVG